MGVVPLTSVQLHFYSGRVEILDLNVRVDFTFQMVTVLTWGEILFTVTHIK